MGVMAKRSSMTFFSDGTSHYSHRVRIVLAEKGVTVDIVDASPDDLPEEFGFKEGSYFLSPVQAQAILDLRLHRLTGLEHEELQNEYKALIELIAELLHILATPARLMEVIRDELVEIKDQFGDVTASDSAHVVVVSVGTQRVGFVVDQLVGQEEVVIKPLGKMLQGTDGMAGATITGDGRIALILDVPSMLNRYA